MKGRRKGSLTHLKQPGDYQLEVINFRFFRWLSGATLTQQRFGFIPFSRLAHTADASRDMGCGGGPSGVGGFEPMIGAEKRL